MNFVIAVKNVTEADVHSSMIHWGKALQNYGIKTTHYGYGELHNHAGKSIGGHMVLMCKASRLAYWAYKKLNLKFKEVDYEGLPCLIEK